MSSYLSSRSLFRWLICLAMVLAALLLLFGLNAAQPSGAQSAEKPLWTTATSRGTTSPQHQLNSNSLDELLAAGGPISLPLPDGSFVTFTATASTIFEAGFELDFPAYKSYRLISAENTPTRGRLVTLHNGIHALIETETQVVLIDPISSRSALHSSSVYDGESADTLNENIAEQIEAVEAEHNSAETRSTTPSSVLTDGELRSYRLAIATDGEYAQANGGTLTSTLDAVVSRVSDLNHIYQTQIGVAFHLVANNDRIIYLDPASDPYTDFSDVFLLLSQNIAATDSQIGKNNYDIGHLFSTGYYGGFAFKGGLCSDFKAGAVTQDGTLWIAAHEIGHSFNASHAFSGVNRSCNGASTQSFEPGSGNSIMAYGGLCGPDNTGERLLNFNEHSIGLMRQYAQSGGGASCGSSSNAGNQPPTVHVATEHITIPTSTPFVLTGSASDPDNDAIQYSWEQHDLGPGGNPNQPLGNTPLFRLFAPSSDSTRTFPQLADLVAGRQQTGELLPNYGRDMRFRLVARDVATVSASSTVDVQIRVAADSGPFRVLAPNGGEAWTAQLPATVQWDVAASNLVPISCAAVHIDLSTDGGFTYPQRLANAVVNNGAHTLVVPAVATASARLRVACATHADHFFFDISDRDFAIEANAGSGFALTANPAQVAMCGSDSAEIQLSTIPFNNFNGDMTIAIAGSSAELAATLTPSNTLLINATPGLSASIQTISVTAGSTTTAQTTITAWLASSAPAQAISIYPASNSAWVAAQPTFRWQTAADASHYELQISRNPLFTESVTTLSQLSGSSYRLPPAQALAPDTTYYWRIRASNGCGSADWTARSAFHTARNEITLAGNGPLLWLDANDADANGAPDDGIRYERLDTWTDKSANALSAGSPDSPYLSQMAYGGPGRVELKQRHYIITDAVPLLSDLSNMTLFTVFALSESAEAPAHIETPPIIPSATGFMPLLDVTYTLTDSAFAVGIERSGRAITVGVQAQISNTGQFSGGQALVAPLPAGDDWLLLGYSAGLTSTRSADQSALYLFGDKVAGDGNAVSISETISRVVVGGLPANVGEIMLFDRQLNEMERQQVEGYLAHKWGLSERLATSHPFATALLDGANLPPLVNSAEFSSTEYSPVGTLVGTIAVTDSESTFSYAIANGNSDNLFTIDADDGELRVARQVPLESLPNQPYYLTIDVTDQPTDSLTARTGSAVISVTVNDTNIAPSLITTPKIIAADTLTGTTVLTLTGSDLDPADTLSYTITSGNDDNFFGLDATSGALSVLAISSFTDPLERYYTLTIRVTDSGTPPQTATATQLIKLTYCADLNVVVSSADAGPCTLRQRLQDLPANSSIRFADALAGSTISLTRPLTLTQGVSINGANAITLSAATNTRLLVIDTVAEVTLQGMSLLGGQTSGYGGAILKQGAGALTLERCTISDSHATGGGGAIYANDGAVTLDRCTISGNSSDGAGGGLHLCGAFGTIEKSSVLFNESMGDGGGLYQGCAAPITVVNSTFYSNSATHGGGIFASAGLVVHHVTLSHNVAITGGGLNIISGAQVAMSGSIVANSVAASGAISVTNCVVNSAESFTHNASNLIADGSCTENAVGNLSGDPLLGALQDNGGGMLTLLPASASPIRNASALSCPDADQRGFLRLDGACDLGAVEIEASPTTVSLVENVGQQQRGAFMLAAVLMGVSLWAVFGRKTPPHPDKIQSA